MRLAFNASIVDPLLSGLGVYAVNLLRELVALHNDLVAYTSCPELCGVNLAKVKRISSKVQPRRGRSGHFRRVVWMQTGLPLRILADRATLLFSPLPEGMLFPVVPEVVVVHDLLPLHFPEEYPRQQYYFRHLVPAILWRSRAIIADSEATKRDIGAFYGIDPASIHVVPAGYDCTRYKVGIEAEMIKRKYGLETYVLYVGNLFPHKNLRRLLSAFALLAQRFPHRLVVAGTRDPRFYPALEAETRTLGLEGKVVFLDYVPGDELPALYAGAEVFVLPSLYEGFGLPALEAMACGTPVVASYAASLPEVTGDAALMFDPQDVQGITGAIETVLANSGMRESLRQRGFERAKQFSWNRTASMVLEVLHGAADR